MPSFFRPPERARDAGDTWFDGAQLADQPPDRLSTAACVACDCSKSGSLTSYDDWQKLNRASYAELKRASAPYAIAVVPGYGAATQAGLSVMTLRVQAALRLLQQGWVAAVMLSGGHQRGGFHEGRFMARLAEELGAKLKIVVKDRLFIEPCACHTSTNARNSLQMLEAMGIREALLVTEGDSIPHQALWLNEMDAHASKDLGCYVGRFALLRGSATTWGVPATRVRCARRSQRDQPGCAGHGPASVFWISPGGPLPGRRWVTAQSCGAGSAAVSSCEPSGATGCSRYRGRVTADRRAEGLRAQPVSREDELAAFDPHFDCPETGPALPGIDFAEDERELESDFKTMCERERPERQEGLWIWRPRIGSFVVGGAQLGITNKHGRSALLGARAELFYRAHWRLAELTRWRHELGIFSTFALAGDWLGTADELERHFELGPAFELGAWFRPRFADAPLPMALLSAGYALPTRGGPHVAPVAWLGTSIPSLIGPALLGPTLRLTHDLNAERNHALGYQFLVELGVRK